MARLPSALASFLLAGALLATAGEARADFALRDGDTVVFLGDSVTAARTYGKMVENYTLLRFPGRKVRFFNAGIGGDTAAAALARLDRDVFSRGATVVTVCFGMNDVGWGLTADGAHVKAHLDGVRAIVRACKQRHARVYVLSPAVTAADPAKTEGDFLERLGEQAMAVARQMGEGAIDVHGTMRAIQRRIWAADALVKDDQQATMLHLADGVHLNDLGQMAMGYAILKGLGAPAEVSGATVDAGAGRVVSAEGCRVTDVRPLPDGVSFVRLDEGLPVNFGLFGALSFVWVPVHQDLNRYGLAVSGLPAGAYQVRADDRLLGTFEAAALGKGVDVASVTADAWQPGGPWDAQASVLSELTNARHDLAKAALLRALWLPATDLAELDTGVGRADDALVELQRAAARPRPYRFTVRKAPPPASPASPNSPTPPAKPR